MKLVLITIGVLILASVLMFNSQSQVIENHGNSSLEVKFLLDLALEKEDYYSFDILKQELKKQGRSQYISHFLDITAEITFLEEEFAKSDDNQYADLPFPMIWKFLDRKKEIRIHCLDQSRTYSHVTYPTNEEDKLLMCRIVRKSTEINRSKLGICKEDKEQRSYGDIYSLQICLIEAITKRIARNSALWPKDWPDKILREFVRRSKLHAETPEEWLLKQAYLQAFKDILFWKPEKQSILGMNEEPDIWETNEFKMWLENHKEMGKPEQPKFQRRTTPTEK